MKLTAITTALALTASTANACDAYVFHGLSWHSDPDLIENVREFNPGLGCRIDGYEVGVFQNSYDDLSAYALRDWVGDHGFGFFSGRSWIPETEMGVFAGVASGYQDDLGVPDHGVTLLGGAVFQGDFVTVRATPSYNTATRAKGVVVSLSFSIGG